MKKSTVVIEQSKDGMFTAHKGSLRFVVGCDGSIK